MVQVGAANGTINEARQVRLAKRDILLLRGYFEAGYAEQLADVIQGKNPEWDGLVICLRIDQDLSRIPEPMARAIYERLKGIFETGSGQKSAPKRAKPNASKRRQQRQSS